MNNNCFAAWTNDSDVLKDCSSGGIAYEIARNILLEDGEVYCVVQDPDTLLLYQKRIEDLNELNCTRKSKYYQSEAWRCFSDICHALQKGKKVGFFGTACQVGGLLSYLALKNVSDKNLVTIDILCHGVSNLVVYKTYLKSMEKKYGKKVDFSEFRTKAIPWRDGGGTSMTIHFDDHTTKLLRSNEDPYFFAFNNNLILRPSCGVCVYAGLERNADITLADFWGISEKVVGKEATNNGVSFVMINSLKGKSCFNNIENRISAIPVPIETELPYNRALTKTVIFHKNRDKFFDHFKKKDFSNLVNLLTIVQKTKYRLYFLLGEERIKRIRKILGKKA